MNHQLLTTSQQRAMGAMFKKTLNDTVLVFVYPHPAPRLFHTFLCPALRILALSDEGEILCNQVLPPNQFIQLPKTRLVLETAPEVALSPETLRALARNLLANPPTSLSTGAIDKDLAFHDLIFGLVYDAHLNLSRIFKRCKTHDPEELTLAELKAAFTPEERGHLLNSAAFLLTHSDLWNLSRCVLRLARVLLRLERQAGFMEELLAASMGGNAWKRDFPQPCIRCQVPRGNWQPVYLAPATLAPEVVWRYTRPENHVFICRRCAYKTQWHTRENIRVSLALGVWGVRFEAFQRWHMAMNENRLPKTWDRLAFPLWPETFGGNTWETGSGAVADADPRPPEGVFRTEAHLNGMQKVFGKRWVGRLDDACLAHEVSCEPTFARTGDTP